MVQSLNFSLERDFRDPGVYCDLPFKHFLSSHRFLSLYDVCIPVYTPVRPVSVSTCAYRVKAGLYLLLCTLPSRESLTDPTRKRALTVGPLVRELSGSVSSRTHAESQTLIGYSFSCGSWGNKLLSLSDPVSHLPAPPYLHRVLLCCLPGSRVPPPWP